jgi:hypothetical protein
MSRTLALPFAGATIQTHKKNNVVGADPFISDNSAPGAASCSRKAPMSTSSRFDFGWSRAISPNFAVQVMPADSSLHRAQPWLRVRTFERGVEAETQVCHVPPAPRGNGEWHQLTPLSGVRHGCGCKRSHRRLSKRPDPPRRGLLQSYNGKRSCITIVYIADAVVARSSVFELRAAIVSRRRRCRRLAGTFFAWTLTLMSLPVSAAACV